MNVLRRYCNHLLLAGGVLLPLHFLVGQDVARKTGEVRGKIVISSVGEARSPIKIDRYSTHRPSQSAGAVSVTPYRLSQQAVVYLEAESFKQQRFPPPTTRPKIDQRDLMFFPRVLPVQVGTIVDFPNNDNLFHNVFSYSQAKDFDLGRYPTGESRSVVFDRPGVVRVYCDIHAHMNATILVLNNPYFASPDDDGSFVLRNVPEGTYTMKLWYGRDVAESRTITVRGGETLNVNFNH